MRHVHGVHAKQAMKIAKTVAMAIGAFALLLVMGGCASIPQRVWQNGANISSSRADHSVLAASKHGFKFTTGIVMIGVAAHRAV